MGDERISLLLTQAASDVPAPALAETAWARAQRVRRRRLATAAGVAAGVLVGAVATGVVAPLRGGPGQGPSPTPTASPSASPTPTAPTVAGVVDQMPERLETRAGVLPAFPPDLRAVAPLSSRPLPRAVMLYQPVGADDAATPEPVYAAAADGSWARLDVVALRFVGDAGGNQALPLKSTSLSPDGRFAAFPQPDELVVVDLTAGGWLRFAVPGFNEQVVWHGPETVLVGQEAATFRVALRDATVTAVAQGGHPVADHAWADVAVDPSGGPTMIALPDTGYGLLPGGAQPQVRLQEWTPGLQAPHEVPVHAELEPYGLLNWNGRAWRNGDLVVRAGWGRSESFFGLEVVAVVDVRGASVVRMLVLGREDRTKGCCEPLGWLDRDSVMLRTDREGVVAWNVRTGTIDSLAAGAFSGAVSASIHR